MQPCPWCPSFTIIKCVGRKCSARHRSSGLLLQHKVHPNLEISNPPAQCLSVHNPERPKTKSTGVFAFQGTPSRSGPVVSFRQSCYRLLVGNRLTYRPTHPPTCPSPPSRPSPSFLFCSLRLLLPVSLLHFFSRCMATSDSVACKIPSCCLCV